MTKWIAIQTLDPYPPLLYFDGILRLQYSENTGAFLGLGSALPEQARFIIFTLLVSVVLIGVLVYIITTQLMDMASLVCYAMILGGGFSNLIDRIFNNGIVVDFLNLGLGSIRTGIFNVADVFITTGVIALVLFSLRPQPQELEDEDSADSTATPSTEPFSAEPAPNTTENQTATDWLRDLKQVETPSDPPPSVSMPQTKIDPEDQSKP